MSQVAKNIDMKNYLAIELLEKLSVLCPTQSQIHLAEYLVTRLVDSSTHLAKESRYQALSQLIENLS